MWARIKSVILGRSVQPVVVADSELVSELAVNESLVSVQDRPRAVRMVPQHKPPLTIRIAAAATNLAETNIRAAEQFGLGSETGLSFDDRNGVLQAVFSNGVTGKFPAQSLGHYDRHTSVYCWSWTNPALDKHATSLAEHVRLMGEEFNEPSLTLESQNLPYDDVLALAAFASHEGCMPLVYALRTKDNGLHFLALGTPNFVSSNGRLISSPFLTHGIAGRSAHPFMFDNVDQANHSFSVPHIDGGDIAVVVSDDGHVSARRFFVTPEKRIESMNLPGWGDGFLWPSG